MKNIFSFGKVKGMQMEEVLNMPKIHSSFTGLQYLWGMHKMTQNEFIKKEIETCFRIYAKDYIIQFGQYKGMSLFDIDYENEGYVVNYLAKNQSEEIAGIVNYYLQYCRNKNRKQYNSYQEHVYKVYAQLREEINNINRKGDIIKVLEDMGLRVKNENGKYTPLIRCPFGCEKKVSPYKHAYLLYGKQGSWVINCCRCNHGTNFIKFVAEQKGIGEIEAINYITSIMGINSSSINLTKDINDIQNKIEKRQEEVQLVTKGLPEVDLEEFGFRKGIYPPYYYNRGFTNEDGEKMGVYYAGKYCKNGFKSRICFTVTDLENRVVGVVGRSQFTENEYYNNQIKYHNIDMSLSRDEQIEVLKAMKRGYIKYYNKLESSYVLYNCNSLVNKKVDEIFICEGPFDVMKMVCHHGYENTVGMFGKDLKSGQLYQLYKLFKDNRENLKIHLFVDNDEAGIKAFEGNVKKLQELGFKNIYKMILKNGKDAAEATKEEVDYAYNRSELQSVRYSEKKITIIDEDVSK
ncbi:toprim domain-containing protein [Mobilitalea sibirica]|uniref:Toprim domain-containing protein n=1 Tax=Mobilitalea sibirica TaxID=1462919 RepID=A0A8J7H306_9FIRM|nr:toprim domain-containing protein [Mobilitalea sibirica]MBH1941085.1 toprim domain-containing protein [Mobilitalea sibirica]